MTVYVMESHSKKGVTPMKALNFFKQNTPPKPPQKPHLEKRINSMEKIRHKVTTQYIQKHIPINTKVLDIGINSGNYWNNTSYNVIGLDKEPQTKTTLIHDIEKPFNSFQQNYYPVITLFEVIEHLQSPYNGLAHIKEILHPNGIFLGSTPNRLHPIDLVKPYMGPDHLYFFDKLTLTHLLTKVGYKHIHIEQKIFPMPKGKHTHFNFDLYPFTRLGRVLFWKCTK